MEKIAAKLAGLLVERQVIEDSMYDIYHYGMLRMLEIGAAFFSSLLICLSMGMIKEGLLFCLFYSASFLSGWRALQKIPAMLSGVLFDIVYHAYDNKICVDRSEVDRNCDCIGSAWYGFCCFCRL